MTTRNSIRLKLALALAASAGICSFASAADEADAPAFSLASSLGYESRYVFNAIQYADSIEVFTLDAAYGGWYAGTWMARATGGNDMFSNEMDTYGGYVFSLSDKITTDLGVTHYAYGNCIRDYQNAGNSTELHVGICIDSLLSPTVFLYRDLDCKTWTLKGTVDYSLPFANVFALDLGSYFGGTFGEDIDYADYAFLGVNADVSWEPIKGKLKLSAGVRASYASEDLIYGSYDDISNRNGAVWYGFTISGSF